MSDPYKGAGPEDTTADKTQDHARRAAEDLGHKARDAGNDIANEARHQARSAAEAGTNAAAGRLDTIAQALKASAGELRGKENWLADAVETAAVELRGASSHLHDRGIEGISGDLTAFARRNPAAFLGTTMLLGFAFSRFAKASETRHMGSGPAPSPAYTPPVSDTVTSRGPGAADYTPQPSASANFGGIK